MFLSLCIIRNYEEDIMKPFDQAWQLLKDWKYVANRIEGDREHLQEPPRLWSADPPRLPKKGGLYPTIEQNWQPAALSMMLGMVQPNEVNRERYGSSAHGHRLTPFDEGEYSEMIPPEEWEPSLGYWSPARHQIEDDPYIQERYGGIKLNDWVKLQPGAREHPYWGQLFEDDE